MPPDTTVRCSSEAVFRRRLRALWDGGALTYPLPESGALVVGRAADADVRLDHPSISRRHCLVHCGERVEIEDLGSANGTRIAGVALSPGARGALDTGVAAALGSALLVVEAHPRAGVATASAGAPQPGGARSVLYEQASRVAAGELPVLIVGETGVGKEVLAEFIQGCSPQRNGPFVKVNCAALPDALLESELMGYERGAFTGALHPRPGLVEAADGGTLLLDEIGELPLALQAKLLRVVENGGVLRLGARQPRAVRVRFIASTNRDLEALSRTGSFRSDLYYRLAGVVLRVPPLRERREEILPLAEGFAAESASGPGQAPPLITAAARAALLAHAWPGNVRELKHAMARAVLLAGAVPIAPEHLALSAGGASSPRGDAAPGECPASSAPRNLSPRASEPRTLEATRQTEGGGNALREAARQAERARILEVLEACGGNQTRAAEALGVSRRTLVRKLAEFGRHAR